MAQMLQILTRLTEDQGEPGDIERLEDLIEVTGVASLCHHEQLEAFGGCRLCMVEVESRGWTSYVVSCLYPVAQDIAVRTRSPKVDKIRKVLVEELMAHAPDAPELV